MYNRSCDKSTKEIVRSGKGSGQSDTTGSTRAGLKEVRRVCGTRVLFECVSRQGARLQVCWVSKRIAGSPAVNVKLVMPYLQSCGIQPVRRRRKKRRVDNELLVYIVKFLFAQSRSMTREDIICSTSAETGSKIAFLLSLVTSPAIRVFVY